VKNLTIYLDMLRVSIECDRDGGQAPEEEESGVREAPELVRRKIPTTKQERLAFRVARALGEFESMRDDIEQSDNPISTKGSEYQPQIHPEGVEANDGELAANSSQVVLDHEGPTISQIPVTPGSTAIQPTSSTQVPQTRSVISRSRFSDEWSGHALRQPSKALPPIENMLEDMDKFCETLLTGLELYEKLWMQFVDSREPGMQAETTQTPRAEGGGQRECQLRGLGGPEAIPEANSGVNANSSEVNLEVKPGLENEVEQWTENEKKPTT
jgi:hypothetical protein